jgi:hypothetical protein
MRPCADRRFRLQRDHFVGLAEMRAAFTVADFGEPCPDLANHRRGDFAGPGACVGPMNVLSADQHFPARQNRRDVGDGGKGRNNKEARAIRCRDGRSGERPARRSGLPAASCSSSSSRQSKAFVKT